MNKTKYIEAGRFLEYYGDWYTEEGTETGFIGPLKDLVEQFPAADVQEVRHGRWKQVGDNTYRCSVCGELSCCCSPYCGECGAKMDEVEKCL